MRAPSQPKWGPATLSSFACASLAAVLWLIPAGARAAAPDAAPTSVQEAAPLRDFETVQEVFEKEAPSQDVIERLYDFMEVYPKDPRCDQVQFWVAVTQQRRKFHNEAVKEFEYVVLDFPKSALVLPALRAAADSYLKVDKVDKAAECFEKIIQRKPKDFAADPRGTACFRDAALWLADRKLKATRPDVEGAVALLLQLPDQDEAVTRVVETYVGAGMHEQAIASIRRLPDSQRILGYRLMATAYAARPGVANLFNLLDEVITRESPGDVTDGLVQHVVQVISGRGAAERHRSLEIVTKRYDRLRRWADYGLCELDRGSDVSRLVKFIGDYNTGGDVETCKLWVGEFHEAAGDAPRAREAYGRLDDKVSGHFRIAETYYGPRAKTKDLPGGEAELSNIVKAFYSTGASAEALMRRAELQAGPMGKVGAGIDSLAELVDRFPKEGEYPPRALSRMGEFLRTQKRQDDAITCYEKVILNYPQSGLVRPAWLQIAACHEEKGEPARAIEVFKTVLRKFPRTGEASAAHTRLETHYKIADLEVSD